MTAHTGRHMASTPPTSRQLDLLRALACRTDRTLLSAGDAGRLVGMKLQQAVTTLCALELRGLVALSATGWIRGITNEGRRAVATEATKGRAA